MKYLIFIPILLLTVSSSSGCTIFTAATDDLTLVGNNEDYWLDAYIWFTPSTPGEFGRITFGWSNGWSQGGVNEKGLFFDWCALQENDWVASSSLLPYDGLFVRGNKQICELMLATCSTVEEAVEIFLTHNEPSFQYSHILIADKSGNSAVVEWADHEVKAIYKTGRYQILTNFTLFYYLSSSTTPCVRYNTAKAMLEANEQVSTTLFRNILSAVHQEPPGAYTVYSNIYDLTHGEMILYQHYDFSKSLTLNVEEELKKGSRTFKVSDIFENPGILSNSVETPGEINSGNRVIIAETGTPGVVYIRFPDSQSGLHILELYDLCGMLVYHREVAGTEVFLPVSGIPKGIYLLRTRDNNGNVKVTKCFLEGRRGP